MESLSQYKGSSFTDSSARKRGLPGGSVVTNLPAKAGDAGDTGSSLGGEDPLEKEMATHSSILAWRIPWTEEPGRLQACSKESGMI